MSDQNVDRDAAIKRLRARRDFRMHLGAYLIINAMLVFIWWTSGGEHFWPIWTIAFWGVGLAFHAWGTYFAKPFTEDEIRREMDAGQ